MKYFSMFSGIGGFEIPLQELNLECVGFSEIDKYAISIYQKHFPSHKNFGDATKIIPAEIPDFHLLVAGFPCQSFSIAGRRAGFNDTRGTLFFDIARIVKEKRPKYLLLENVKGLLSHDGGRTFKTILSTLTELGYDAESMVFNSYFFGAGRRERIFIFAVLRNSQSDSGERQKQTPALYDARQQGIRNTLERAEPPENMRDAERIIRTFANLPAWLDSWDTVYAEKEMPW